ncbi:phosphatidate phosphatase LPIN2-like isoform X1 [Gadus macrocephalus]|uniref:phosphatidate phosphatase LPIN2-like isoform X1 n=2 Tax=Gadus macrocephalus TaxID=80720 RepID=UPI0028CBB975|nr:phosphatidate phosphatase LPIN2-like isoform X1 [Gadus macrocephalus]
MAERGSRGQGLVGQRHLRTSLWSQTMNLVGQLAETVFVTVKELYRGLNPATLTGGIDVIVVRQPDGSYQCSPFHVRFGKLGVLRSKEKVVDIEINGEPVNLHMKLGDNGEAFFVEENEDMEFRVPAHLCTSPIPMELPELGGEENGEVAPVGGGAQPPRRKKRRRKRFRSDSHLREEGGSSSEEREREQNEQESPAKEQYVSQLQLSKSIYFSISEEPGSTQTREVHPHSEGEFSPPECVFYSRSSSPKSDSELVVKPQESSGPQMQWNWGGFPKVRQSERSLAESHRVSTLGHSNFRTIERQDSFDDDDDDDQTTIHCSRAGSVTVVRPLARTMSLDLDLFSPHSSMPTLDITPLITHSTPNGLHDTPATLAPVSMDTPLEQLGNNSLTQTDSCEAEKTLAEGCPSDAEQEDQRTSPIESTDSSELARPENGQSKDETTTVAVCEIPLTGSIGSVRQNCPERKACTAVTDTLASDEMINTSTGRSISVTAQNSRVELLGSTDILEQHSAMVEPSEMGAMITISGGNDDCTEAHEEGASTLTDREAEGLLLTNQTAEIPQDSTKADKQDRKKAGKRSQHLGPTGIYLDDLTTLEPEVAALYFPKSEMEATSRSGADQGSTSGTQSPQSVGSGAMDSGAEYLSDSTTDPMDVSMSLCGCVGDTSSISQEKFKEHIVTFKDFLKNPGIIEDPNLVICINSQYYNWAVAAPMILSKQAFQKNLPKSAVDRLVKDKMPKKSGRWWFSWRRRDMDNNQPKPSTQEQEVSLSASPTIKATLDDMFSDEEAGLGRQAVMPTDSQSSDSMSTCQCISQMYKKSLRLTSEQIERLNLRDGANQVVFSVTTQYQGTCRCEAAIYLWNWDDHVIISDIDGTITKSDALGHILPQFGKDWTHQGIAKLYHKIHKNGYKFLYCSARAIGMAAITKDYLRWVNDKGTVLPKGPVLLAPSSLFSALHREVIEKKPEVFKIACLTDIKDLFNPQRRPFYAAFGNRTNDAYAYKQVGVPDTRIFTINPKGELTQEKTKGNKSSYNHLGELVEHFFPMLSVRGSSASGFECPEFSHFSYWREPLPPLDLEAML